MIISDVGQFTLTIAQPNIHIGDHMSRITIRMGATDNTIDVDGIKIDRNSLTKGDARKVRGIIVGALEKDGYFKKD